ncbi:phosphoribosylamine--glycine ligase [Rhodohalobacter sp. 8-1]|uniref:phosphoribosylamine--glycine ligase n=1 Tax=Rhodohalobacter sp. 8-1 TaxID=3131972 RepID=UPI0030EF3002
MDPINVLLLGNGGREHAIAWKLEQSLNLKKLYTAPGNPGTEQHGINIDLDMSDFQAVETIVQDLAIDLVIVGPEQPLVDGISDYLEERDIPVFGPSKAAAQLEGSKSFAKAFMQKNNIPTAGYRTFSIDEFDKAKAHIKQENRYPVVLKADGLAGGKGVFICESEEEMEKRLTLLAEDNILQEAASTLVVEDFMVGEEASVFVICDGKSGKVIQNAQDHKRIGEGDTGLNTGGMGAYSPAPVLPDSMLQRIEEDIIEPTIQGMLNQDVPYQGILYVGLMITKEGPKVVEYNCRFGDPECQVILPPLKNDLLELIQAAVNGTLSDVEISLSDRYYCSVVLASGGYPKSYEKGFEITGIEKCDSDALIFHSGTVIKEDKLCTNGGRVLNVVGSGQTLQEAIDHSYENVKLITFKDSYFRRDIGKKGLK